MSPRQARGRSGSPRQHLWDEAVIHLAHLGREHIWRFTVGRAWMELRDEHSWVTLHFHPDGLLSVQSGIGSSDEATQELATDSYAQALEFVERSAVRH